MSEGKIDGQFNPAIEQELLGDKSKEIEGKKADIFNKIEEVYTRQTNDRQSFGKQSVLLQNVLDAYRGLKVIYDKDDSENLRTQVEELRQNMEKAEEEKNKANEEKEEAVEEVKRQKTTQFEYIDSFCNEILQKLNALDEDNKKNEAEVDTEIKKLEEQNNSAWNWFSGTKAAKIDRDEIKRRKKKANLEKIIADQNASDPDKDEARRELNVLESGTLEEITEQVKQINEDMKEISDKEMKNNPVTGKQVSQMPKFNGSDKKRPAQPTSPKIEDDFQLPNPSKEKRDADFRNPKSKQRPAEVGGGKRKTKRRRSRDKSKKSRNRRH